MVCRQPIWVSFAWPTEHECDPEGQEHHRFSAKLQGLAITWAPQAGFAALPTSRELLADTGAGLTTLGTFAPTTAQNGAIRGQNYYDIGLLSGVTQIQLRIPESATGGVGVSVVEFEAFLDIPEPATAALAGSAALLLLRRRAA